MESQFEVENKLNDHQATTQISLLTCLGAKKNNWHSISLPKLIFASH